MVGGDGGGIDDCLALLRPQVGQKRIQARQEGGFVQVLLTE